MRSALRSVAPTDIERIEPLEGDDVLPRANVVMTRAFSVDAAPETVWPWIEQLGKRRAGWYLPSAVERWIPRGRRAIRSVDGRWQTLAIGDVIPDYGGKHETFTVHRLDPGKHLVYWSRRGHVTLTWSITLRAVEGSSAQESRSRILLRLRLQGVKRPWLAKSFGDLFDALTIAGMAAGLRERLPS